MARKLRLQYEGAVYHVMNRGDHRREIFRTDGDRQLFLQTLGEACAKTDWQIHAWCLMSTHFHLVIETLRANLVEGTGFQRTARRVGRNLSGAWS
jgi:REP element-mobilizing transposase RayT